MWPLVSEPRRTVAYMVFAVSWIATACGTDGKLAGTESQPTTGSARPEEQSSATADGDLLRSRANPSGVATP